MACAIDRAEPAQLDALCAIEREAVQLFRGHPAWPAYAAVAMPRSELLRALARGLVWVALDAEGTELGFVWLDPVPGEDAVEIAEIDVLPAHGRRGIGAALLEHACAWARAAGYRRVDLGTLGDVPWNAPFYAGHGFGIVDKHAPAFALALARDRENGFPDHLRVFMSRPLAPLAAGDWSVWPAPARLGLGRRAVDGGAAQRAAYCLLDWGDEVRVRVSADGEVRRAGMPAGETGDLATRAARLLREHAGTGQGVEFAVSRRMARSGGLGVDSSHAATLLVALNERWGCGLGAGTLEELAGRLGARVPAFLGGFPAWTEEGGNPVALALPRRHYVVLDPGERVSATTVREAAELTPLVPPATISAFISGEAAENAFTAVVRKHHPRVAAALDWLGRQGAARLSGSGGCSFLEVRTLEQAQAIAARCPSAFTAHVATGAAVSPLCETLARHRRKQH
ncbi:MAG TPA: GNAT family N-acetyltransferase [Rhodanobacter sp.]|nr:GNAT family N-acetyltransferase [Rhodanobacter sp.]